MGGEISAHHCYFAVQGFDMNGAEIKKVGGFKNEGQAIEFVKARIGVNEHLCGVVKREDDLTYSASIKPTFKANPTKNTDRWHRCLNIFYGKKLTSNHQDNPEGKEKKIKSESLSHFLASFDMWGGDLQSMEYPNFQEAYNRVVKMIKLDSSKCATIVDLHSVDKWQVYLKDPRKANPSSSQYHSLCQTMFVGREV